MNLIRPKDVVIQGKNFVISKFPAWEGREIAAKYVSGNIPKIGSYELSREAAGLLMNYVGVKVNDQLIMLTDKNLINNHVVPLDPEGNPWEMQCEIEAAMWQYNCSFFQNGGISNFFVDFAKNVQQFITKILMDCLVPSSRTEKQPSTNSEQSTV